MELKNKNKFEDFGKKVAFVVMYFIFGTILYFVLVILEKFPKNWNYFHIILIVIFLIIIGKSIKYWLNK